VKNGFGAVEVERNTVSGGFQVQARIGDSIVVMAAMDPPYQAATKASIYVYVDDVDATYARAIAAGGDGTVRPTDRPYQERSATVKDSFGNIWHIATYKGRDSARTQTKSALLSPSVPPAPRRGASGRLL
jgi:PhnB protein